MSDRDVLLAMFEKAGIEPHEDEMGRLLRIDPGRFKHSLVIFPDGSMFNIEFIFNADGSLKGIEAYE